MNSVFLLSAIIFGYSVVLVRAIGPLGAFGVGVGSSKCDPSITTASGTYAMHKGNLNAIFEERKSKYFSQIHSTASGQYCSGDLIFEDTFDIFDTRKWQHENTLAGDGVSNTIHFHLLHLEA